MSECEKEGVPELRERVSALDRLMEAKMESMSARLESHNQFREQINKERSDYVTRREMLSLFMALLAIVGVVAAYFSARIR